MLRGHIADLLFQIFQKAVFFFHGFQHSRYFICIHTVFAFKPVDQVQPVVSFFKRSRLVSVPLGQHTDLICDIFQFIIQIIASFTDFADLIIMKG